jgi:hypothetical protein
MKTTAMTVIGAALILTLVGCAPAADDVEPKPVETDTAIVEEAPEPAAEPEVTYYPAPVCWDILEPAGYQYEFNVTPEEGLAGYEATNGEGSAEADGVSFSCAMRTEPGQDLAGADAWMDELIAQGWVEQSISGNDGAARDALNADGTVRAAYTEFNGGQILFSRMAT